MCCAREANINAISAREDSAAVFESSRMCLIFSPVGVPPGSRVTVTAMPRDFSARASFSICVLFPLPSSPSNVMNFPRLDATES